MGPPEWDMLPEIVMFSEIMLQTAVILKISCEIRLFVGPGSHVPINIPPWGAPMF